MVLCGFMVGKLVLTHLVENMNMETNFTCFVDSFSICRPYIRMYIQPLQIPFSCRSSSDVNVTEKKSQRLAVNTSKLQGQPLKSTCDVLDAVTPRV